MFFVDLPLYSAPDIAAAWTGIVFAVLFAAAAAVVAVRREDRQRRGGAEIAFLVLAVLCVLYAWEVYFPTCPRGWWC
jgi:hypothetical protein